METFVTLASPIVVWGLTAGVKKLLAQDWSSEKRKVILRTAVVLFSFGGVVVNSALTSSEVGLASIQGVVDALFLAFASTGVYNIFEGKKTTTE